MKQNGIESCAIWKALRRKAHHRWRRYKEMASKIIEENVKWYLKRRGGENEMAARRKAKIKWRKCNEEKWKSKADLEMKRNKSIIIKASESEKWRNGGAMAWRKYRSIIWISSAKCGVNPQAAHRKKLSNEKHENINGCLSAAKNINVKGGMKEAGEKRQR